MSMASNGTLAAMMALRQSSRNVKLKGVNEQQTSWWWRCIHDVGKVPFPFSSKRPLDMFRLSSSLLSPSSSLSSSISSGSYFSYDSNAILRSLPRGKGFGNFTPKPTKEEESTSDDDNEKKDENDESDGNDNAQEKDAESSTSTSTSSTKDEPDWMNTFLGSKGGTDGDKNQKKKEQNKQNSPPPPNGPPGMLPSFALLLLAYMLLQYGTKDNDGNSSINENTSREITWSDFCIHLLEEGQVEKILVTNQGATARVYLKPGAKGMPSDAEFGRGGAFSSSKRQRQRRTRRSTNSNNAQEPTSGDGVLDDNDTIDFHSGEDSRSSRFSSGNGPSLSTSSSPSNLGRRPQQLVYRFSIPSVDTFEKKLQEAHRNMKIDPRDEIPVQYAPESTMSTELLSLLPSFLFMGLILFMLRSASGGLGGMGGGAGGGGGGGGGGMGGMFQVGKSKHKKVTKEDISVTFRDVAGCTEAKKEIMEFVDFLQNPDRFTKLGAKIPKGALLSGPPGTGKTLLAKAVAGEADVPFYSISGSDFVEMFVGVGPSRVRDLFKEARANSPCIVFIDEIDAVGRKRGRGGMGGNDERENTLNQLLVEMDGFSPTTGVVVLAGTNRADILDQALTRPGRFDRQIMVDKPDVQGRKEIFQVHLAGIKLEGETDEYAGRLAGLTPGFVGADIANICNEAAIVAARRKAESVSVNDFEKATDRIIGGLESNKIMSKEERDIVAHHEAGHAVAGWFLEHADPLLKVTIIPRTSGALGYAQYLPREVYLRTEDQIMDIVCMALAGRAAEEIFFGGVTTGASDDLRRVTELVYSTIQLYGMNSRLGQLAFPKDPDAMFEEKRYSEKTAKAMDEEAKAIVDAAYQRTLDLLRERKEEVELVAARLLEKETITHDDVVELIGARPYLGDPAYEEFISRKKKMHEETDSEEEGEKKELSSKSNEEGTTTTGLNPEMT